MKKLLPLLFLLPSYMAIAQQEMPLYGTEPIPNSKPAANAEKVDSSGHPVRYSYSKVSHPTLTVWLPPAGKRTGTAVIVCPGGSYVHLAMTHEGTEVAAWLNSLGITAFVLKYRLPSDETMADKTIGPLQDAQRAIQVVRQRAGEWGVDPGKVGILGFSAGGNLTGAISTNFEKRLYETKDDVDQVSCGRISRCWCIREAWSRKTSRAWRRNSWSVKRRRRRSW